MIGLAMKILGVDKIGAMLVVGAVIASLAGGAYWYVDHRGYARAEGYYKGVLVARELAAAQADAAEKDRQSAANDKAKQREAVRIAADAAEADQLQSRIEELQREAGQDPDRDRPALGAASVRRIGSIR